eukprot:NODE_253_length_11722_cov_0.375118.p5 type:complete len:290 gc:universal NODE_253_length_11722_cov_0.375118:1383-514(-)
MISKFIFILFLFIISSDSKQPFIIYDTVSHIIKEHVTDWSKIEPYLSDQQKHKLNLIQSCPIPNIYPEQIDNKPDSHLWNDFDDILLNRAQRKLDKLMKIKQRHVGNGKGIVYVTSSTYFQITVAGLLTLRAKTSLPIEVFHHDELNEKEVRIISLIPDVSVYSLVRRQFNGIPIQFSGGFRNYHLKLAALLATNFQEILYLDDDNYLMQDPEILFSSLEYLNTGLLLWKDTWKTNPNNPIFDIFNVKCKEGFENESGQLVVNKNIHYETLLLGFTMLQNHDYWSFSFI